MTGKEKEEAKNKRSKRRGSKRTVDGPKSQQELSAIHERDGDGGSGGLRVLSLFHIF